MTRRRAVPLAALLATSMAWLACARPAPLEGWNVVILLVDSLRARQLSAYGHEREVSPTMDRLAREGVVFEHAYSASSYTRESVAALFTGELPSSSGATGWGARPDPEGSSLASLFSDAGHLTGMLSNSVMLKDPAFVAGFQHYQFVGRSQMMSGHSSDLADAGARFVEAAAGEPFLLYLHFLDPHGPYAPPDDLRAEIPVPEPEDPLRLYGEVRDRCSELVEEGFGPGSPRFEDLVARYEAEVRNTDMAIGAFLEAMAEAGVLDRTLVILTADHGEEFLEHGFVEHAWTLYEESIHVPLVFWAPAVLEPRRASDRVSLVDVLPTLARLFDLDAPGPGDGQPLLEAAKEGVEIRPRTAPVVAETLIQSRNLVRTVVHDDWKYIASLRWLEPPQREKAVRLKRVGALPRWRDPIPLDRAPVREELYHLASDPQETLDLSSREPERLEELRDILLTRAGEPPPRNEAPPPTLSPEEERQLKALGYK